MIEHGLYHPPNRGVPMQQDRRWPLAFGLLALLAFFLWVSFALVGWPRLQHMSLRYRILHLRSEVNSLRQEERKLEIEINQWKSPAFLSEKARELGLRPPSEQQMRVVK